MQKEEAFTRDACVHNKLWGSRDSNKKGEYLLDILVEIWEIFNVWDTPSFVIRLREEMLDITFGTPTCMELVRNWYVSEEPTM